MTDFVDCHAANHMTVAIARAMTPKRCGRTEMDTLFMGGVALTDAQADELAAFGLRKNWKIIYPFYDPADALAGPIGFRVIVTDGLTQTFVLSGGRLWQRDRRSPAVLVFAGGGLTLRLSSKGRLIMCETKGSRNTLGYELALASVRAVAAGKPGQVPVVSSIGSFVAVLDMRSVVDSFAMAA